MAPKETFFLDIVAIGPIIILYVLTIINVRSLLFAGLARLRSARAQRPLLSINFDQHLRFCADRVCDGRDKAVCRERSPSHLPPTGPAPRLTARSRHDCFVALGLVGSERESVRCPILGRILQFHGFGPVGRPVLSFEEQVAQVAVAAATPDDRLDVAVDGFYLC